MNMPTLSDVQSEAQKLLDELERASNPLALAPTQEEIEEVLYGVIDAESDDCEKCRNVEDCAQGFSELVSKDKPNPESLRECLAVLLESTGVYGLTKRARMEARAEVAAFLRLARED
jgi:hypothetical protein